MLSSITAGRLSQIMYTESSPGQAECALRCSWHAQGEPRDTRLGLRGRQGRDTRSKLQNLGLRLGGTSKDDP